MQMDRESERIEFIEFEIQWMELFLVYAVIF